MNIRKRLLVVLLGIIVLLFVGCKEAETFPKSRELIVVNGTGNARIVGIEVEVLPFGQRKIDLSNFSSTFSLEAEPLEKDEQFVITLSPFAYRAGFSIDFDWGSGSEENSWKMVVIDFPDKPEFPTKITLVNDGNVEYPGYALEITGEYVNFSVPMIG